MSGKQLSGFVIFHRQMPDGKYFFPTSQHGEYIIYPTLDAIELEVGKMLEEGKFKIDELEIVATYTTSDGRIHIRSMVKGANYKEGAA